MKKLIILVMVWLTACTALSYPEKEKLYQLKAKGINTDVPVNGWEKPASPFLAGLLNVLPGCGNFYLGLGKAGDANQNAYGLLNLLFWPISVVWAVPQAVIDANTINERDLVYFYQYVKNEKNDSLYHQTVEEVQLPQWVDLYEKEGFIGQPDKNVIHYIGYGESVLYQLAHDYAVDDAYEKAQMSIMGKKDPSKKISISGMRLISEFKTEKKGKISVWVLYAYPKIQMEKDVLR